MAENGTPAAPGPGHLGNRYQAGQPAIGQTPVGGLARSVQTPAGCPVVGRNPATMSRRRRSLVRQPAPLAGGSMVPRIVYDPLKA